MFMADYLKDHLRQGRMIRNILIIVGATVFIGVVWEFLEYLANQTLIEAFYRWFRINVYFMGNLNDTMLDLLMDISGGILLSLSLLIRKRLLAIRS